MELVTADESGAGAAIATLEITVIQPVRVYAGVRFAQLTYFTLRPDGKSYSGKYGNAGAVDYPVPVGSGIAKDFDMKGIPI